MTLYFNTVKENCDANDSLFLELKKVFSTFIEPIYGNQQKPLEKIRMGKDRKCQLLFYNDQIEGILVYKTKNSNEFEEFGVSNALELKTLILTRKSNKLSGLMVSALYKQIGIAALENNASCVVSTVSSEREGAFNIARRLGFTKVHAFMDKNVNKVEEFLVVHPKPLELVANADKLVKLHQAKTHQAQ